MEGRAGGRALEEEPMFKRYPKDLGWVGAGEWGR